MALTEAEELEMLELEEEEAMASAAPAPRPSALNQLADMSSSAQETILGPLGRASDFAARGFSKAAFATEAPVDYMQAGIGKGMEALAAGEGALAEGISKYGTQAANWLGAPESVKSAIPYAAAAIPLAGEMAASTLIPGGKPSTLGLSKVAESAAPRSMGMGKAVAKKMYGGVERTREVGREMLDRGVIRPFSSTEKTLERAQAISDTGAQKMEGALSKLKGKSSVDATDVGTRVIDRLQSELQGMEGGAFAVDQKVISEIADTITAAGQGPIPFEKAQLIKQKLQERGKFNRGANAEDNAKAAAYRKASGIFREELDNAVKKENVPEYFEGKKEYGLAEDAMKGITDQHFAEAGNKLPTLRGSGMAAGALASGSIPFAALVALLSEYGLRKGAQLTAYTAGKAIPATAGSPAARKAILSQLVGNRYRSQNERQR